MKKLFSFLTLLTFQANAQDAYQIIKRADEHLGCQSKSRNEY